MSRKKPLCGSCATLLAARKIDVVRVTHNGVYTQIGWTGSALGNLDISVNNNTTLVKKIEVEYTSRLVEILEVTSGC